MLALIPSNFLRILFHLTRFIPLHYECRIVIFVTECNHILYSFYTIHIDLVKMYLVMILPSKLYIVSYIYRYVSSSISLTHNVNYTFLQIR